MNIRCPNLSDYKVIAELNRLAFEGENEAQLVEYVRHSDRYIPELELVADLDGTVAGHILFSYMDLVGQEHLQVLGLAPMAVLPEFQRRGIGSLLVRMGLKAAEAREEVMII